MGIMLRQLLEEMEEKLGGTSSGRLRRESAQAKGERIITEELRRLKWKAEELKDHPKTHGEKLRLVMRLRPETTLTIRQIAERLCTGSWKSLNNQLYLAGKAKAKSTVKNIA